MGIIHLLILMCLLATTAAAKAQTISCLEAVSVNGPVLEVSATGQDDTENIQCALNEAARLGYREVLLTSPEYIIGAISTDGFTGDLKGKSATSTLLAVSNGFIDCGVDGSRAVLTFGGGAPTVRNLSIEIDEPCISDGTLDVIRFQNESSSCDNRTVFGNVDRIVIRGSGADSKDVVNGVVADTNLSCDFSSQQANGGLIVNRVEMEGLDFGVISALANSSPADITFNTISRIGVPITVMDARQSTKIFRNVITYNDVQSYGPDGTLGTVAVFVGSTELSPKRNSTLIQDNTFNDSGVNSGSIAIISGQNGLEVDHSFSVIDNRFFGSGEPNDSLGIVVLDTPGGIISKNRFKDGDSWIYLSSGSLNRTVDGWAIVGNDFSNSTAMPDITLDVGTEGNVVGSGQSLGQVLDLTLSNDVLLSSPSSQNLWTKPRNLYSPSTTSLTDSLTALVRGETRK